MSKEIQTQSAKTGPVPLEYFVESDRLRDNVHPLIHIKHHSSRGTVDVGILSVVYAGPDKNKIGIASPTMPFPHWVDAYPEDLKTYTVVGEEPVDCWLLNGDEMRRSKGIPGKTDQISLFPDENDIEGNQRPRFSEQELARAICSAQRLEVPEPAGVEAGGQVIKLSMTDDGKMALCVAQLRNYLLVFGQHTTRSLEGSEPQFRRFVQNLYDIMNPDYLTNQPTNPGTEGIIVKGTRKWERIRSRIDEMTGKNNVPNFQTASLAEIQEYYYQFAGLKDEKAPAKKETSVRLEVRRNEEIVSNNMIVRPAYSLGKPFDFVSGDYGIVSDSAFQILKRFDENGAVVVTTMVDDVEAMCVVNDRTIAYVDSAGKVASRGTSSPYKKTEYPIEQNIAYPQIVSSGGGEIFGIHRSSSFNEDAGYIFRIGRTLVKEFREVLLSSDKLVSITRNMVFLGPQDDVNFKKQGQYGVYEYSNGKLVYNPDLYRNMLIDSVSPGIGGLRLVSYKNMIRPEYDLRGIDLFDESTKRQKTVWLPGGFNNPYYFDNAPSMAVSGDRVCMLFAGNSLHDASLVTCSLARLKEPKLTNFSEIRSDPSYSSIRLADYSQFTREFPDSLTASIQVRPISSDKGKFLVLAGKGVFTVSTR